MKRNALITWGYMVEVVAAALVYAVLWMLFGGNSIAAFFIDSWIAWSTLCGLLFTAAGSLFVILVNVSSSEFGAYLASRSGDTVYKRAFGGAIAITFLSTVAFIFAGTIKATWIGHASGVLLILSIINLYSMCKNASDLMKMHTLFENVKREVEREGSSGTASDD